MGQIERITLPKGGIDSNKNRTGNLILPHPMQNQKKNNVAFSYTLKV